MVSESKTGLSESQLKTAKTCFAMYDKWKKTVGEGKQEKELTVAHYFDACIKGYPKKSDLSPSLLKSRLNGITLHAKLNSIKIEESHLSKAGELIANYKKKKTVKKEKKEE